MESVWGCRCFRVGFVGWWVVCYYVGRRGMDAFFSRAFRVSLSPQSVVYLENPALRLVFVAPLCGAHTYNGLPHMNGMNKCHTYQCLWDRQPSQGCSRRQPLTHNKDMR